MKRFRTWPPATLRGCYTNKGTSQLVTGHSVSSTESDYTFGVLKIMVHAWPMKKVTQTKWTEVRMKNFDAHQSAMYTICILCLLGYSIESHARVYVLGHYSIHTSF